MPSAHVTAVRLVNWPLSLKSHHHARLSGGGDHPRGWLSLPSVPSQCRAFQRLKAFFNQFMPGLRARFVWKQNDSTAGLAPI